MMHARAAMNPGRQWTRSAYTVAIGLLALGGLTTGCDQIESRLYERAARQAAQPDRDDWLSDGALHVILCGTGSPIADASRAAACAAIIAGGRLFLVDVGPGSWENVARWRLPRARLRAVFLTHFHSDHIGDLGETVTQSWIAGRVEPLPVFGPPGVSAVVGGFNAAYAADVGYRVAHHGPDLLPPLGGRAEAVEFTLPERGETRVVFDADGIVIRTFRVNHDPVEPAVGYRFDYAGRSVLITGDADHSPELVDHARGADIIVHDALAKHMIARVSERLAAHGEARLAQFTRDILDYHASPAEAAALARDAGARMLVLTHLVPPVPNRMIARIFLAGTADVWSGRIVIGEDGMYFALPGASSFIREDRLH